MSKFILRSFLFTAFSLKLQATEVDSLLKIIQFINQDTNKVTLLLKLSQQYIDSNKFNNALIVLEEAKTSSQKLNYKIGLARSYCDIGQLYIRKDDVFNALPNFLKSLKIYEETSNKKGVMDVLQLLLPVYLYQHNYDKAIKTEFKVLSMAKSLNNDNRIVSSYVNLGIIYSQLKNYDLALNYLFKAIKIEEPKAVKKNIISAYGNIANVYFLLSNYNEAITYYTKVLDASDKIDVTRYESNCYTQMGICYLKLKSYHKSFEYLSKAKDICLKINDEINLKTIYYFFSELYLVDNNYKQAYDYVKLYSNLNDSIFVSETTKQIAEMNTKYETEKKDEEIKFLNKEKELKEVELIQKNINHRNTLISVIALLIFGSLIGVLFFQIYRQKQRSAFFKLEHEKTISDLSFLKAQVNPHMIFNTINTIYIQLDDHVEEGRENLLKFSDVMRYQLYDCNEPFVDIKDEIVHIYNYIELQKLRKAANIKITVSIDETIGGVFVAPLLFIPLVENAFKYLSNFKDRDNFITLTLFKKNNTLVFNCDNTFIKKPTQTSTNYKYGGIGLVNLKRRLELIYPQKHKLTITQDDSIYKTELIIYGS